MVPVSAATDEEVRHAVRLAMRLLHPDRHMNLMLGADSPKYQNIIAAFKLVNNLKESHFFSTDLHE